MSEYIKESIPDKQMIIEMIGGIANEQYLDMIYGFVKTLHEMEEKEQ